MTYVITNACVGVKAADCLDVCPVDCIHPRKNDPDFASALRLYIDPSACINCGSCMAVCPVEAAVPEDEGTSEDVKENEEFFK